MSRRSSKLSLALPDQGPSELIAAASVHLRCGRDSFSPPLDGGADMQGTAVGPLITQTTNLYHICLHTPSSQLCSSLDIYHRTIRSIRFGTPPCNLKRDDGIPQRSWRSKNL